MCATGGTNELNIRRLLREEERFAGVGGGGDGWLRNLMLGNDFVALEEGAVEKMVLMSRGGARCGELQVCCFLVFCFRLE